MSLFPAYSDQQNADSSAEVPQQRSPASQWLENNSFVVKPDLDLKALEGDARSGEGKRSSDDSSSGSDSDQTESKRPRQPECRGRDHPTTPQKLIEFNGDEEFYVDKKAAKQYNTIRTLHKPACPRYRVHHRTLGRKSLLGSVVGEKNRAKRYYRQKELDDKGDSQKHTPLDENEYTLRMGQLNRKTMDAPSDLQPWLDLIALQDHNPYKWSRLLLAEKKLDYVQRALVYHPQNDQLYRIYIDTANATYPSHDVSKMIDRLLHKDPHNLTLWQAQIMTTQGTMARCTVPDVLRIYERCMKKMYNAQRSADTAIESTNNDNVMLKLFNNCALFLRQAGLYEQFFALVKLALELNVLTPSLCDDLLPQPADQATLIEYEELILQSGLPMNEIWLRIEKLRQGFNFLPYPPESKCDDPQRIVFNEDVCHYVYPLKSRENSFRLLLLIVKLLKVPCVQTDCFARQFDGDSDAVEDVLAACIRRSYALPSQCWDEFHESLFELAKELAISPTFLSNSIGHEIYARCVRNFLQNCAAAYAAVEERKRIAFLTLWCRFERLLLVLERCGKKLTADYVKSGRNRFKAMLKQRSNRNILSLYVEFALYEVETLSTPTESIESVERIFEQLIDTNVAEEDPASELCHACVTYAEVLLGRGRQEEAARVLVTYAMSGDIKQKASVSSARKLAALKLIEERLERTVATEGDVDVMALEQHILPDHTVSLLKMHALLQYTLGQKQQALGYLDKLLLMFQRTTDRQVFLRESLQELYVTLLQLPAGNCFVSNTLVSTKTLKALCEFPRNYFLLERWSTLSTVPWYKLRASLLRINPTVVSVVFLIAVARYRFVKTRLSSMDANAVSAALVASDLKYNELIVRNRILDLFRTLTSSSSLQKHEFGALHRNSLLWRCYLRCLSDQSTAFETSKKCLLTALDECPWSKALYLDGATYVPQELSHLQDLIIEKQLRIYALPEELEILREH